MLEHLQNLSIEYQAICQQAPIIWDAETPSDARTAKDGCLGRPKTDESEGTPPCPLVAFCRDTGIEINAAAGVWGGLTPYELRKEKQRRERNELRRYIQSQKKNKSN